MTCKRLCSALSTKTAPSQSRLSTYNAESWIGRKVQIDVLPIANSGVQAALLPRSVPDAGGRRGLGYRHPGRSLNWKISADEKDRLIRATAE